MSNDFCLPDAKTYLLGFQDLAPKDNYFFPLFDRIGIFELVWENVSKFGTQPYIQVDSFFFFSNSERSELPSVLIGFRRVGPYPSQSYMHYLTWLRCKKSIQLPKMLLFQELTPSPLTERSREYIDK